MPKYWKYECGKDSVVVRNAATGCELHVNGQMQDKKNGLTLSADMRGRMPDGKEIKVSLGGIFTMQCSLFVDNVLQKPVEVK